LSLADKHGFTKGQQESFLMSDIENFVADIVSVRKYLTHAKIFTFRSSRLEDPKAVDDYF